MVDTSTIDVDAASANGVLVARADKTFAASTTELALGLLLDVARNITISSMACAASKRIRITALKRPWPKRRRRHPYPAIGDA